MTRDISFILKALPHRYPFLLVDRVLEHSDDSITALKNVTVAEPHFPGHFPGFPVMPGVLQVEALAQTSGLLIILSLGLEEVPEDQYLLLAGMDDCRFRKPVMPGDQLLLHSALERQARHISRFRARASVGEQTVCEAALTIAHIRRPAK